MKSFIITIASALAAVFSAAAQKSPVTITKNSVGTFKLGLHYNKVKPAVIKYFASCNQNYDDMEEKMSVYCYDAEGNVLINFYTGSFPQDKKITGFQIYAQGVNFKTPEGCSMESTASELLEAGGELDKTDMGIHILLNGLYFWFEDSAMNGRRINPEAKPFTIGTAPGIVF